MAITSDKLKELGLIDAIVPDYTIRIIRLGEGLGAEGADPVATRR